jgi:signal transduction histidine kinase/CheY-like chemotaxis protein
MPASCGGAHRAYTCGVISPACRHPSPLPDLSWGAHACHFYRTATDLLDCLVPFIAAGLERDEKCVWVTCEPARADAARAALARSLPDVDERIACGQLVIVEHDAWYTGPARPTSRDVIDAWLAHERDARAQGYAGLRLTGNTFWLQPGEWKSFAEYEETVHAAFRGRRIIALCSYSLERCGPSEIVDVVRNHSFALIRKDGEWEAIKSATSTLASALIEAGREHSCHLYEAGGASVDARLTDWLAGGMVVGDAALVVATERARAHLREALAARGLLSAAPGRYLELDAEEMLGRIAPDGAFQEPLFLRHVAPTVRAMSAGAPNVRVFGQMVDLLWQRGHADSALRLEQAWNRLREAVPFGLSCSLRLPERETPTDAEWLAQLRAEHGQVHACGVIHAHDGAGGVETLTSQLAKLQRVTSLLTEAITPADVASIVAKEMRRTLGADEAALALAIDGGARLAVLAHTPGGSLVDGVTLCEADAPLPLAAAFREGAAVIAADREALARRFPQVADRARALVTVPLVVMGERLGALGFAFAQPTELGAADRALLEDLARQTACALQRARLYEKARAARDRLALLADVTARVSSAKLDLDGIVDAFATEVTRGFADACAVRLLERPGAPLDLAALRRSPQLSDDEARRFLDALVHDEVLARVTATATPQLLSRLAQSAIVAPLRASGDVHGVIIALRDRAEGRFEDDDLALVQDLADRVGLAVRNALLFREVERERRVAEEANRAKDEFLAMLGHELRNPLSPILTALQLMQLRGGEALARERQVIERQVRHMTGLVDDLLDLARVTRGKLELERTRIDLADIVARAVEMTSPLLERRAHHLRLDAPSGLIVDGDSRRLSQVVANLLSNAAKYTPPGGHIRVEVRRDGEAAALTVSDDGIGIEPALLSRIFHAFVQAPRAIDRSEGGLGIGLTIVRRLVELHGGAVSATSGGPGKGSAFSVRLPLVVGATVAPADGGGGGALEADLTGARRRILVVDDNRDAAEMLGAAFRMLGHDVREAFDGPAALDLLSAYRPDVAFVDIGLPVMDGYELAGRIHAIDGLQQVPLVAVTGYGQDGDRARSRAAGFAEHVVKPVRLDALTALVDTLAPARV